MKGVVLFCICILSAAVAAAGQRGTTFTGMAVILGSELDTRPVMRPFTLTVRGRTSGTETARYVQTLESVGQDALQREMDSNELGRFSLSGSVAQPLHAVIVHESERETRIRAVFRWMDFGEWRSYRSADHPFAYIEIRVDRRTGQGDGTIIPAARIRFRPSRGGGPDTIQIAEYGAFPGQLMGVRMRGRRSF
jgi:hypothetical protein